MAPLPLRAATTCSAAAAWSSALALALTLACATPAVAQAGDATDAAAIVGEFVLDTERSDDVRAAIRAATSGLSFLTRGFARRRLARTNEPYPRLVIRQSEDSVRIVPGAEPAIEARLGADPIRWRRLDGETFDVGTTREAGRLEQTFVAPDGVRRNSLSLAADGRTLLVDVTVTSGRLPRPLRYRLVYARLGQAEPSEGRSRPDSTGRLRLGGVIPASGRADTRSATRPASVSQASNSSA